jgi:hypothetical protein
VSVCLVLHYLYGSEVRQVEIGNIGRPAAERFVNKIGQLRPSDGIVTITAADGIAGMIPARGIVLAEIKERP